jgi:hypothetical protein
VEIVRKYYYKRLLPPPHKYNYTGTFFIPQGKKWEKWVFLTPFLRVFKGKTT